VRIKTKREINQYKDGYSINKDSFLDLGSESAAYFYGWVVTDGCLIKSTTKGVYGVSLELATRDEDLLHKFKTYLGTSNAIRRRSRKDSRTGNTYHQSALYFSDDEIIGRLTELGLEQRKSLKETCPDVFKFNKHFWRGALEGDGFIAGSNSRGYRIELVGSESFVNSFKDYCKYVYPNYEPRITSRNNLFSCHLYSYEPCKAVLDSMYKDSSIVLDRKYKTYLEKYYGDD
jgi:DNA-binding transcriptional regulator WhiA